MTRRPVPADGTVRPAAPGTRRPVTADGTVRPAGRGSHWPVAAAGVAGAAVAAVGLVHDGGPVDRWTTLAWLLFGATCVAAGQTLRPPATALPAPRPAPAARPAPGWRARWAGRTGRAPQPAAGLLVVSGLLLLAAAGVGRWGSVEVAARLAVLGWLGTFPVAVVLHPSRPAPRVVGPVAIGTVLVTTAVALARPTAAGVVGSMAMVIAVVVVAEVWWRYEGATAADRRALLWVALAGGTTLLVGGPLLLLGEDATALPAALVALSVPVAMVLGVRRPDAADVRQLTVQAVVLTVTALLYVAVFCGAVAAVRIAGDGSLPSAGGLAILGAVLATAFQPTRTVLRGAVDELLFGDRADPGRAMSHVGERLSDDPVLALRALRQALVLPYAALLADGTVVAASGTATTPTRTRVLRAGAGTVGELVVGLRSGELRLRPGDETVLDVLAPALGQALHARLLADELRRSRGELVSAVEEERRRLRRDLHDGLGPTLTGVAYAADAARNQLRADPAAADALLAGLRADTAAAITEIRRLVDGLRPPMLDELGLTQAIRQRARQLRTADGRALVVTLDAPDPLPAVPAAVEVVAFRIVVEALTNVCRHAGSDRAAVCLRLAGGCLELEVGDAGRGGPWTPGVGITAMRERAESVGGTCEATATPTGGRVTARLPL